MNVTVNNMKVVAALGAAAFLLAGCASVAADGCASRAAQNWRADFYEAWCAPRAGLDAAALAERPRGWWQG